MSMYVYTMSHVSLFLILSSVLLSVVIWLKVNFLYFLFSTVNIAFFYIVLFNYENGIARFVMQIESQNDLISWETILFLWQLRFAYLFIACFIAIILNRYACLKLHTAQNDRFLFLSESYLFIYWWVFLSSPCNACE